MSCQRLVLVNQDGLNLSGTVLSLSTCNLAAETRRTAATVIVRIEAANGTARGELEERSANLRRSSVCCPFQCVACLAGDCKLGAMLNTEGTPVDLYIPRKWYVSRLDDGLWTFSIH